MVAHWPLIGRREELSIIDRTLAEDQYRGLLLAGAPGVGKTRLAREALVAADAEGCETRWAVASRAVAAIPFGAVAHLLPPAEEKSTHLQLLQQTGQWLTERAGGRRVVLGIDDAHMLDDASADIQEGGRSAPAGSRRSAAAAKGRTASDSSPRSQITRVSVRTAATSARWVSKAVLPIPASPTNIAALPAEPSSPASRAISTASYDFVPGRILALAPAIRGGATVMDHVFNAEDAPGNGSEQRKDAESLNHLKIERSSEKSWAVLDLNQ